MYEYHLVISNYEFLRHLDLENLKIGSMNEITIVIKNCEEFKY